MGKRVWVDLVIRGVSYPTAQAAAAALGVTQEAVMVAARKGALERCGLGLVGRAPLPVRIRGRVFPSARAAAQHFQVQVSTIFSAIADGREDRVGLAPTVAANRSQPVVLGGMAFRSKAEASRRLGFQHEYVARAMLRRSERAMVRILAAAMRLRAAQDCAARRAQLGRQHRGARHGGDLALAVEVRA